MDLDKKKVSVSIAIAALIVIGLELALQIRAQIRFGQSIFNVFKGETTFEIDDKHGIKLLRKNALIEGNVSTIRTNSIGLRSPEVDMKAQEHISRIVLLGASTVMGTYTRNNEDTWSYQLQRQLKNTEVINGGIAGYSIMNQLELFDKVLLPLKPDLIIWYPGFNDISGYCRKNIEKQPNYSLVNIEAPSWSLLVDLAIKNTMWLRTTKFEENSKLSSEQIDTSEYEQRLSYFLKNIKASGVRLLPITMARAFRREMPQELQLKLSETARYYNDCFDVNGLHDVYDRHNDLIDEYSKKFGYSTLRLDKVLPGGLENFGDATHFSIKGTKLVSEIVAKEVSTKFTSE